jgi:hypothetical protein
MAATPVQMVSPFDAVSTPEELAQARQQAQAAADTHVTRVVTMTARAKSRPPPLPQAAVLSPRRRADPTVEQEVAPHKRPRTARYEHDDDYGPPHLHSTVKRGIHVVPSQFEGARLLDHPEERKFSLSDENRKFRELEIDFPNEERKTRSPFRHMPT